MPSSRLPLLPLLARSALVAWEGSPQPDLPAERALREDVAPCRGNLPLAALEEAPGDRRRRRRGHQSRRRRRGDAPARNETGNPLDGVAWPAGDATGISFSSSLGAMTHVFAVGDWGALLPNLYTAPNVRPMGSGHKCPHNCWYVHGIDDQAQLLVAEQMKLRAGTSRPQYVLNVGDNLYWAGIEEECGDGYTHASKTTIHDFAKVWQSVYGGLTSIPWITALGNHDYGGRIFNMGWDQQIAYSHHNHNWILPARYYSRVMYHPGYSVEYFIIDSNAFDAKMPGEDPEHNLCGPYNKQEASCASIGGPTSLGDCRSWFWKSYGRQQYWLQGRLAASKSNWQIVVTHFPCGHDYGFYSRLHLDFGLDFMVTGHKHSQEIHDISGMVCIITGGGGGITSEFVPSSDFSNAYGFFDLTFSKSKIHVELVNFRGNTIESTWVYPKHKG